MSFSIIKLYLSDSSHVFVIWGQHEADDLFLLDKENRICGFSSLGDIEDFFKAPDTACCLFFKDQRLDYSEMFSSEILSYSVVEMENTLRIHREIDQIGVDDAGVLIEWYNLISDFFYQLKDDEYLSLRKEKNMEMFFDYCYYRYFWKKGEEWLELEKRLKSFDYSKFATIYKMLSSFFVDSIKITTI